MKFLFRHSSNSRKLNWAGRNFTTNSRAYSLLIYTQAKMQTEINNNSRMAAFGPIGTAQIIRIVSYPIRKKSRFWLFCMWFVKEMYHALLPNTDYRDKGRGHDLRLLPSWRLIHYANVLARLALFWCEVKISLFGPGFLRSIFRSILRVLNNSPLMYGSEHSYP